jgi:galactose mutarotase-like enzyme
VTAELFSIQVERSGFPAYQISNEFISLEIVPQLGGRIVSLRNVRTGREWCWRPGGELHLFANHYGDSFADSPNAGFDECFPTIEACEWQGRQLPCHGEVWSVPWTLDEAAWEQGVVATTVSCKQSPFELKRHVSIHENQVHFEYSLRNTGRQAEAYLWAFHPMIQVTSEDRLELSEEVQTLQMEGVRGAPSDAPEDEWAWPSPFAGFELDRFELGANECASVKGFTGKLKECSARIASQANGEYFKISWEAEPNPFLGVWINRGAYQGFQYVAALEPTNGQTDSLCRHHTNPLLPAGAECSWSMRITLGGSN